MLLGKSRILSALQRAAKASKADQTLICAQRGSHRTLRFAGGRIHQNFHEEEVTVWVKVACGNRMGVATTCSLSFSALMKAVESAMTIARVIGKQVSPAFSTERSKSPTPDLTTYFPSTAHRPLAEIVEMIRRLWAQSAAHKMELAGSFTLGEEELAVAGSKGLAQYQPFSIVGFRFVATQGHASGFGCQAGRDIDTLDPQAAAQRAWDFCRLNKNPKSIPLGKYDVLLEPEAVVELMEWLGYIGFGAKPMVERTGFMAGRIGERIMSRKISILDDGSDLSGLAVPFDYEGTPKTKVSLIEKGVAAGIVCDSHYGKLLHRGSTGHAGPFDDFEGPLPTNLFILPGQTPYTELLPKMDRGLWICRFHYVNGLLRPQEALMTGLTRDGTLLIRNGKVAGAAKNLRFTQSILEAFSNVVAISKEHRLLADPSQGLSAAVVPALLIKNFTFTGQTQ